LTLWRALGRLRRPSRRPLVVAVIAAVVLSAITGVAVAAGSTGPVVSAPSSYSSSVGQSVSLQVTASGGAAPYTWSATGLPTGLTIGVSSGVVSGTPSTTGTFTPTITAKDSAKKTGTARITWTVDRSLIVTTPPANTRYATIGQPFSLQETATGGTAPYTWTASGLPSGLAISPASGLISGSPTAVYDNYVYVTVTDSAGATAGENFELRVSAPLTLDPVADQVGQIGIGMHLQLRANGGDRLWANPYMFTVTGLPPGVSLSQRSIYAEEITGTPTAQGSYTVSVSVADEDGRTAAQSLRWQVGPAGSWPATVTISSDLGYFATGQQATLTATADRNIAASGGDFALYIFNSTTGAVVTECSQAAGNAVWDGSHTTCTVKTSFLSGPPQSYVAEVAGAVPDATTIVQAAATVQAVSGTTVTLTRQPWTISLSKTPTCDCYDAFTEHHVWTFNLVATTNQAAQTSSGTALPDGYGVYIVDVDTGKFWGTSCQSAQCSQSVELDLDQDPNAVNDHWYAVVARDTSAPPAGTLEDVQATSNVVWANGTGGPVQPGEVIGGSNPSEPGNHSCTCDPIDVETGAYIEQSSDIGISGKGPGLAFTRTYTSTEAGLDNGLGHGWAYNYHAHLSFTGTGSSPDTVTVAQENGSTVQFARDTTTNAYAAPNRVFATLTRNSSTGTWTFVRRKALTMTFGSGGQLLSEADRNGNTVNLGYDSSGNLATVTAPGGRTLTFTWAAGHLATVTDSAGRQVSFGYDAAQNLTTVTNVNGKIGRLGYDSGHNLTTLTTYGGSTTTNSYDGQHRVASQTDPDQRTTSFAYTGSPIAYGGGTTTITGPDGTRTVDTYNGGQLLSSTEAAGTAQAATTSYTYDTTSNIASSTDPLGNVTVYTYDARGNKLTQTDPLGKTTTWTYDGLNEVTASTDPLGRQTSASYDSNGNRLSATRPSGLVQRWTYNTDGTIATSTTPAGTTSFSYNPAGDLTATTDPDNRTRTISYDAAGNATSVTDSGGHTTSYTYDAAGHRLTETTPLGSVTTVTYDRDGHVLSTTDANNHTTAYTYDPAGQVTSRTTAAGRTTSYTYTAARQVETVTDPNGHTSSYTYDRRGNQLSATDADGNTTTYRYDLDDRLTGTTLPSGATSQLTYDADSRITTTTDADGFDTTYRYDDAGQRTQTVDAQGNTTSYTYTPDGLLKKTTAADNGITTYRYDNADRRAGYTDPDGHPVSYSYDPSGLLSTATVLGATTSYDYTAAGKLYTVTQPDGNTQAYRYDADGNTTGIDYSDPATPDVSYTYDAAGQRATMTDGTGTTSYTRNVDDLITQVSNGAGATVGYGYDPAGRLTTLSYPGNRPVSYTYDPAGQLTGLTDWANHTISFGYTTDGRLSTTTDPNGVTSTTTYDPAGQPTQIDLTAGSTSLATFGYSYDPAGLISQDTDSNGPGHTYQYDPIAQLTGVATTGAGTDSYAATSGGQLTTIGAGGTLDYDTTGYLRTLSPPAGPTTSYGYDANGSRTSATTVAGPTTTYRYTQDGNLLSAATTATSAVSYTTDGDGLRQSRTQSGVTKLFTWDTTTSLPQLLDDGTASYLYGPELQPVAQLDDTTGAISYLHTDRQGSVRLTTDSAGTVTSTTSYNAFGQRTGSTGTAQTAIGYTGEWTDPSTGLVYLRARDYDPATGQFLTLDPAVDLTRQPYAYAGNNPVLSTDPSGLYPGDGLVHGAEATVAGGLDSVTGGFSTDILSAVAPGFSCDLQQSNFFTLGQIAVIIADPEALTTKGVSLIARAATRDLEHTLERDIAATLERSTADFSPVLLDTSAARAQTDALGLLKPGECAVVCQTVQNEAIAKGFPGVVNGLPVIPDGLSAVLRGQVAGQLRAFGAAARGLENDATIGATALEHGLPLITGDRALANAVSKLGGEARYFRPGAG
jgi:RHS repeat-associated protein